MWNWQLHRCLLALGEIIKSKVIQANHLVEMKINSGEYNAIQ